jgi:threonine/homoserine/homoserine lactone efflux protein
VNIFLIFSSSFILALSGALVPGPLFTVTVSESARRGFIAGPMIIFGHGLLELSVIFLLLFNAIPFLTGAEARTAISLFGGIVLITMGVMLLRDARSAELHLSSGRRQTGMHPVLYGIIGSISNPYWVIWWITIGLGYLVSSLNYGIPGVIAFFAGHISADLLWYSVISYAVSRGQKFMGVRGYRYLLSSCGIFLVLFGGWFLWGPPL